MYDAAIRRAGMLRVPNLGALFGAADILTSAVQPEGRRLGILTNGGGLGVLATDALLDRGGKLAELTTATLAQLDAVLPHTWSRANPVDIIGDADGARYRAALTALTADPGLDAMLVLYCPTGVSDPLDTAQAVIQTAQASTAKPILASWVGGVSVAGARHALAEARVPSYDTPERATQAFMYLADYHRNQEMLTQTPPSLPEAFTPDSARARALIAAALAEGRKSLNEIESKALLECYAIPTVPTRFAATPDEARELARALPAPYVLKIVSPEISHKSDAGGVLLGLPDAAAVRAAAERMRAQIAAHHPDARIQGFAVQPLVQRHQAHELIAGIGNDA
ncbi:MAG TPA: acetate--CoA ligase family protein, partial [Gammaproteobacteria bacterium]|nr:acetate--CoA ligase family protein [Gammaproteobacteria bacterium]